MQKLHIHKLAGALLLIASVFLGVAPAKATVVDLTTTDSGTLNGAIYSISFIHPAGTGVYDPFLTIQANGTEQGYNAGTATVFDTKRVPQWNHEIRLSDLEVTTVGNVQYYGFTVDINEPNGGTKSLISLDALRIYTSTSLRTTESTNAGGDFNGSLGTLRYDIDAGGNNFVKYDDQHAGSGTDDLAILIPVSYFAGANPNDYVYMYQQWGKNFDSSLETQGGFEETAIMAGNPFTPIPEVPAFLPLGLVVAAGLGLNHYRRSRKLVG
jgi:hypothetical protein